MSEGCARVLELLKKELAFLESGGYKHAPRSPRRASYIFEDSPSCPNFSDRARPHLCENCWLMEFVAADLRSEQVPCRFVELAAHGVTVDRCIGVVRQPNPRKHCGIGCNSAFARLKRNCAKRRSFKGSIKKKP